jgi:hypothetical protein
VATTRPKFRKAAGWSIDGRQRQAVMIPGLIIGPIIGPTSALSFGQISKN